MGGPLAQGLRVLCLGFSVAYLVAFYWVALTRLTWPFDLEWMEGGMVMHAARVLAGQPIYAAPTLDFVPYFYTPGYPAVVAALGKLSLAVGGSGLSFGLARGVSLLCTTWTLWILFCIGRREAHWQAGLLAAGIYSALFRTNGAFYDLARPDALFMAILCSAVYVAAYHRTLAGAALAGALFAVGFFTKQTVSVFVPATAAWLVWRSRAQAAVFLATAGVLSAAGVYLLDRAHDGWFWTFIFQGHQGHLFYWKNILMEYWRDTLFLAPALLLVPLLWFRTKVPVRILAIGLAAWWTYAFVFRARTLNYVPHMYYRELWYETPRWQVLVPPALIALILLAFRWLNRPAVRPGTAEVPVSAEDRAPAAPGLAGERLGARTDGFWLWMFLAGAGASGLNHSTQWAYANCFMLLSAFGAVLVALALRDLSVTGVGGWKPRGAALLPGALVVQFIALGYSPAAQVPQPGDEAALAHLNGVLAEVPGKVFFPAHPLSSYLRDGTIHTHQMGIQDVGFMGGLRDLAPRLGAAEFGGVVVDEFNHVPHLERGYYRARVFAWERPDTLRARTGFEVRPRELWLPHRPAPAPLRTPEGTAVDAAFDGTDATFEGWQPVGEAFANAGRAGRNQRGMQGMRSLTSSREGTGSLRSAGVVAGARLGLLLGGTSRKAGVRIWRDGVVVAEQAAPRHRDLALSPHLIDLSAHTGATVVIELFDDDPNGALAVDALRWWAE